MELTLYKREMKGSWKLLVIFGAVLTMYVAIIISMYEPDMLKLLDRYAQAMPELMAAVGMTAGAADLLGRQSAENLMYTSSRFGTLFASQQYDAALAEYCRAFNALVLKRTDADISLDGLFGTAQATPAPTSESRLWDEVMDAINDSSEAYQARHDSRRHTENGLSAGGWIVLAVLVLIVLKSGRRGRAGRMRGGCGCAPLGWLFSLLGLNVLIDTFRRRS